MSSTGTSFEDMSSQTNSPLFGPEHDVQAEIDYLVRHPDELRDLLNDDPDHLLGLIGWLLFSTYRFRDAIAVCPDDDTHAQLREEAEEHIATTSESVANIVSALAVLSSARTGHDIGERQQAMTKPTTGSGRIVEMYDSAVGIEGTLTKDELKALLQQPEPAIRGDDVGRDLPGSTHEKRALVASIARARGDTVTSDEVSEIVTDHIGDSDYYLSTYVGPVCEDLDPVETIDPMSLDRVETDQYYTSDAAKRTHLEEQLESIRTVASTSPLHGDAADSLSRGYQFHLARLRKFWGLYRATGVASIDELRALESQLEEHEVAFEQAKEEILNAIDCALDEHESSDVETVKEHVDTESLAEELTTDNLRHVIDVLLSQEVLSEVDGEIRGTSSVLGYTRDKRPNRTW